MGWSTEELFALLSAADSLKRSRPMAETAEERVRAQLDTAKRQGFSMVNRVDVEDLSALLSEVERLRGELAGAGAAVHLACKLGDHADDELEVARARAERLEGALRRIADWCPATQEITLAHQMSAEAEEALSPNPEERS